MGNPICLRQTEYGDPATLQDGVTIIMKVRDLNIGTMLGKSAEVVETCVGERLM